MKKRRFTATQATTQRDLRHVIDQMGATSLRIEQDIMEGTVAVIFDRGGQRYVFRCRKYDDSLDNLRAAQLTITYLWRALEEYGVDSTQSDIVFNQFFLGFMPTPDDTVLKLPSGAGQWWEVLGVRQDASREAIKNAYRALTQVHHPDHGGDPDAFMRVRKAYEDALASF